MKAGVTLIFLYCLTCLLNAQDKGDEKEIVGFACSYSGRPTKPVIKVAKMLQAKKYKEVASLLSSENQAEKYLAVISVEKLAAIGKYELSDTEKILISKARSSHKVVLICSGCTYFDKVSLMKMLADDNFLGSKFWIEEVIKIE
jgi:hypothetical protein